MDRRGARRALGPRGACERFLGPLRPLRMPGGRCLEPVVHPSHGRAVVRADAFFVTDGETFTRVDPPEPALAVAFGTSDWGVAIVEGGALAETRDGGRSWTPRSAPVARGLALRAVLGGVVVTDANGSGHLIQGGRDTPKVGPSRAPREAEPAMRRALVDQRDGAALRVAVTPEGPCTATYRTLAPTAFETFFVVDPSLRADVRGAAMRVTGRRVVALAAPQDARSLRFPGAVGRVWSAGEGSLQLRWRLLGDLVTRSASIVPGSFGPSGIDVLAATRTGLFVCGTGSSVTPVCTGAVDTHLTLPSPTLLAATEVPGAGVWFDARGASLVGGVDDGHTIRSLRAVLRTNTPSPMEALE